MGTGEVSGSGAGEGGRERSRVGIVEVGGVGDVDGSEDRVAEG